MLERAISRLKEHISLRDHKMRGLRNIAIHVLYCILAMLFIVHASMRIGKPRKARSKNLWLDAVLDFLGGPRDANI